MEHQQVSSWALKRRDLNPAERQLAYFYFFWFVCSHVVPQHILGDDKAHTSCLPVGHHFNGLFADCSHVSIETIWRSSPDNSHKFISNGVSSPTLLAVLICLPRRPLWRCSQWILECLSAQQDTNPETCPDSLIFLLPKLKPTLPQFDGKWCRLCFMFPRLPGARSHKLHGKGPSLREDNSQFDSSVCLFI